MCITGNILTQKKYAKFVSSGARGGQNCAIYTHFGFFFLLVKMMPYIHIFVGVLGKNATIYTHFGVGVGGQNAAIYTHFWNLIVSEKTKKKTIIVCRFQQVRFSQPFGAKLKIENL
jgi:hypothetical protein